MRFYKYVAVQGVAYGIDMGTFLLLTSNDVSGPILANVCAKALAGAFAFFAHRHVTFEVGDRPVDAGQASRYLVLLGFNIPVSALILKLFLAVLPVPVVAKFLSDVAGVLLTYWVSKIWVFAADTKAKDPQDKKGGH